MVQSLGPATKMKRRAAEPLPPRCPRCRAEGDWVASPDGGYCRCDCARGQALAMGLPAWRRQQKRARLEAEHRAKMPDGKAAAAQTFA
jgi:hypothetical protein